jgi:glutamate synthase (NADPH/NADH) large chain
LHDTHRGLYNPDLQNDACGIGLIVDGARRPLHSVVMQGLEILRRLAHRGACGADHKTGDGAGMLLQIPDAFFRALPEQKNLPPSACSSWQKICRCAGSKTNFL